MLQHTKSRRACASIGVGGNILFQSRDFGLSVFAGILERELADDDLVDANLSTPSRNRDRIGIYRQTLPNKSLNNACTP